MTCSRGWASGMACLPLLRGSKVWAAPGGVKRLMIVMCTNGWQQQYWRPQVGSLMTQTLPPTASPLEPHKANVMFLPGMSQPAYGGGGHGSYVSCLASGPNDSKGEYRVPFSPTIDQIVGPKLARTPGSAGCSCRWACRSKAATPGSSPRPACAGRTATHPSRPEEDIYKAYADVYGGAGPAARASPQATTARSSHWSRTRRACSTTSARASRRFKARLGNDDRQHIESHLHSIRDFETQLAAPQVDVSSCKVDPGAPMDAKAAGNYPTLDEAVVRSDGGFAQVRRHPHLDPGLRGRQRLEHLVQVGAGGQPRLALDGPQPGRQQAARRQVAARAVRGPDRRG